MLNKRLYDTLKRMCGSVAISGEDEPVELNFTPVCTPATKSEELFIHSNQVTGGEHYAVNCPFCGDKRKRLWVSYACGAKQVINGVYIKFSAGLAICYNENCLKKGENWYLFQRMLDGAWGAVPSKAAGSRQAGEGWSAFVKPMPESLPLDNPIIPPYVLEYIKGRGFDPVELATQWDVRVGVVDMWRQPALIIPVFEKGSRVMWQARYIGDDPGRFGDGGKRPKYYTPPGSKKSWVLYNMDDAQSRPSVVVVEGVFDAMRVGKEAVALFGKEASPAQERMLYSLWGRGRLIWLPDIDDPESVEIAEKKVTQWNARNLFRDGAYVVKLPCGDPADTEREQIWNSVREQTGS